MGLFSRRLRALFLCALIPLTCGGETSFSSALREPGVSTSNVCYLQQAALGIETLQSWYVWRTGLWQTTGWWNAANALTALVNYSRLSGSTAYQSAVANTYSMNASGGFLNRFYDDEGWWALAWIDAYDWTQNPDYLNMASSIFNDMTAGWDNVCGGGIWWSKDRTYKNAIANELFLSVAAHLANRVTNPDEQAQLIAWAESEWLWFSKSGMINPDNLINDGLDGNCQNNGRTTWTYNQGVILGGLVELYQQDPDPSLPDTAQAVALAAIRNLTDANGILHDRCEPNCGRDGVQFKGIFLRNLMALNDAFPDARYVNFAEANAQSIWNEDQGPDYQFGQVWSGPFDFGNAAIQSSALDALIAAAEMTPDPPSSPNILGRSPEANGLAMARSGGQDSCPIHWRVVVAAGRKVQGLCKLDFAGLASPAANVSSLRRPCSMVARRARNSCSRVCSHELEPRRKSCAQTFRATHVQTAALIKATLAMDLPGQAYACTVADCPVGRDAR